MPWFSQVEAWAPCSEATLSAVLERLCRALARIGYDPARLENWLAGVRWYPGPEAGGAAGLGPFQSVSAPGGEVQLEVAPYLFTWSYAPDRSVALVQVLFETDRVLESVGRFRSNVGSVLWYVMRALHSEFSDGGVFLTNELTDGQAIEHLLTGEATIGGQEARWWFDAALLPIGLGDRFNPVPTTHVVVPVLDGLAAANRRAWSTAAFPWDQHGSHDPSLPRLIRERQGRG